MKRYIKRTSFTLLDQKWIFTVLNDDEFKLLTREVGLPNAEALVMTGPRQGFFKQETVTLAHIGHELIHVIVHGLTLDSMELKADQIEELLADYIGDNLERYTKLRKDIFNKLKGK